MDHLDPAMVSKPNFYSPPMAYIAFPYASSNRAITTRFTKLVANHPSVTSAGRHGSGERRGGGDVRGLLVQRVRDAGPDRAA
jgi:hypothetical protein